MLDVNLETAVSDVADKGNFDASRDVVIDVFPDVLTLSGNGVWTVKYKNYLSCNCL